jgi:hypothetical protein
MNWKEIEKDFKEIFGGNIDNEDTSKLIVHWFHYKVNSDIPPTPLTEEEKSEFYTTNLTADIKPNYGK